MSREVRMVPIGWDHPKDAHGQFVPLHTDFSKRLSEWIEEKEKWDAGLRRDYATDGWKAREGDELTMAFEEWDGRMPVAEEFMPEWPAEQCTQLMMYETCSEGTPISPSFSTPEELAHWLADNGASAFGDMTATYEQWLATCKSGWAVSAVMDGKGLRSGVEAMADKDDA